jgi:hypothetical protein
VRSGKSAGLHSNVDHDVDIVGRSCFRCLTLDLVQEDHLTANEQPMLAALWRQFDRRLP